MDRGRGRAPGFGADLTGDMFPVGAVDEPRRIQLRDREIPYVLKRSRRRARIAFLVDEGGLSVHAPWNAPETHVEYAIRMAEQWILRKLEQWAGRPPARALQWRTGDIVEYLGSPVPIDVIEDPFHKRAELRDDRHLMVRVPRADSPGMVRELVIGWYRRHATRHFTERLGHYASALGVATPKLYLTNATTRWGSCNVQGHVRLNWRLMQAPPSLVDYVVAHETAHLLHLNHSARFWKAVGRLYPDYESARTTLAAMSRHYMAL